MFNINKKALMASYESVSEPLLNLRQLPVHLNRVIRTCIYKLPLDALNIQNATRLHVNNAVTVRYSMYTAVILGYILNRLVKSSIKTFPADRFSYEADVISLIYLLAILDVTGYINNLRVR